MRLRSIHGIQRWRCSIERGKAAETVGLRGYIGLDFLRGSVLRRDNAGVESTDFSGGVEVRSASEEVRGIGAEDIGGEGGEENVLDLLELQGGVVASLSERRAPISPDIKMLGLSPRAFAAS